MVKFGGPERNILFGLIGSAQIDFNTGKILRYTRPGSSLFAFPDLATGREYNRVCV